MKKKHILIASAAALGIAAYWYYSKNKNQLPELVTEAKDTLTTTVKTVLNPTSANTGIATPKVSTSVVKTTSPVLAPKPLPFIFNRPVVQTTTFKPVVSTGLLYGFIF